LFEMSSLVTLKVTLKIHSLVQYPHYVNLIISYLEEDNVRTCSGFSVSSSHVTNIYGLCGITDCAYHG